MSFWKPFLPGWYAYDRWEDDSDGDGGGGDGGDDSGGGDGGGDGGDNGDNGDNGDSGGGGGWDSGDSGDSGGGGGNNDDNGDGDGGRDFAWNDNNNNDNNDRDNNGQNDDRERERQRQDEENQRQIDEQRRQVDDNQRRMQEQQNSLDPTQGLSPLDAELRNPNGQAITGDPTNDPLRQQFKEYFAQNQEGFDVTDPEQQQSWLLGGAPQPQQPPATPATPETIATGGPAYSLFTMPGEQAASSAPSPTPAQAPISDDETPPSGIDPLAVKSTWNGQDVWVEPDGDHKIMTPTGPQVVAMLSQQGQGGRTAYDIAAAAAAARKNGTVATAPPPAPESPVPTVAAQAGAQAAAQAGGTPQQIAATAEHAARIAYDNQTLSQQSPWTQAMFRGEYKGDAEAEWQRQHNAELERNQRLYGSQEPRAGTAPVAGAPAGTVAAPDRRIGATPPPVAGQTAMYGVNGPLPTTPAAAPAPVAARTAPPGTQPPAAAGTTVPGVPGVATPQQIDRWQQGLDPNTGKPLQPVAVSAPTTLPAAKPASPPNISLTAEQTAEYTNPNIVLTPEQTAEYNRGGAPAPTGNTRIPGEGYITPEQGPGDGGTAPQTSYSSSPDDILTISRKDDPTQTRQTTQAQWDAADPYDKEVWNIDSYSGPTPPALPYGRTVTPVGGPGGTPPGLVGPGRLPSPGDTGTEVRLGSDNLLRSSTPMRYDERGLPVSIEPTLAEAGYTRLSNRGDAPDQPLPSRVQGEGLAPPTQAELPRTDPIQTAIQDPKPLDALASLAGQDQGAALHIAQGISALLRGDAAGKWAEPYLNDVARLAGAKEEAAKGNIIDPRTVSAEYIEKWKDAFYGSDPSVPLVKELDQQMIDYAAAHTPAGKPFRWQEAFGPSGDKGLISSQVTDRDCGPNAFSTILRSRGYNAAPGETYTYAKDQGYHNGREFQGPAAMVALATNAGFKAEQATLNEAGWAKVDSEIAAGRPVMLSGPSHWWVVTAKNDQGQYYAGATALKGNNGGWQPREGLRYDSSGPTDAVFVSGDGDPNSKVMREMSLKPPASSTRAMLSTQTQYQSPAERATTKVQAGMDAQAAKPAAYKPPTQELVTPNTTGVRTNTIGMVIHSTQGNSADDNSELQSTLRYFKDPRSQASSNAVIGVDGTIHRIGNDDALAWHAGEENNSNRYGVELVQRAVDAKAGKPFTDAQYRSLAALTGELSQKYSFAIDRTALVGHEELEQGKRFSKTDPGPQFDWERYQRESRAPVVTQRQSLSVQGQQQVQDIPVILRSGKPQAGLVAGQADPTDQMATIWTRAKEQTGDQNFADGLSALLIGEGGLQGGAGDKGQSHGPFQFYWGGGEGNGFESWLRTNKGFKGSTQEAQQMAKDVDLATEYYIPRVKSFYDKGTAMGYTNPVQAIAAGGHNSKAPQVPAVWKNYADAWDNWKRGNPTQKNTVQSGSAVAPPSRNGNGLLMMKGGDSIPTIEGGGTGNDLDYDTSWISNDLPTLEPGRPFIQGYNPETGEVFAPPMNQPVTPESSVVPIPRHDIQINRETGKEIEADPRGQQDTEPLQPPERKEYPSWVPRNPDGSVDPRYAPTWVPVQSTSEAGQTLENLRYQTPAQRMGQRIQGEMYKDAGLPDEPTAAGPNNAAPGSYSGPANLAPLAEQALHENPWSTDPDAQPARHAGMRAFFDMPEQQREKIYNDSLEAALTAEGITDPAERKHWIDNMRLVAMGDRNVPGENPLLNPFMMAGENKGTPLYASDAKDKSPASNELNSSAMGYYQFIIHDPQDPAKDPYGHRAYIPKGENFFDPVTQQRMFIRAIRASSKHHGDPASVVNEKWSKPDHTWGP